MCLRLSLLFALLPSGVAIADEGFFTLFNGRDLSGWTMPETCGTETSESSGSTELTTPAPSRRHALLALDVRRGAFLLTRFWGLPYTPPPRRFRTCVVR